MHDQPVAQHRRETVADREHESLLARAFMAMDAPAAIMGSDGLVVVANVALQRLAGRDAQSLHRNFAAELINPADRPEFALATGVPRSVGFEHRQCVRLSQDVGLEVVADLTATFMGPSGIGPSGGNPAWVVTLRDLTTQAEVFQVAGKIRMIGLGEVKTALGPRWPALRERAMAAAEHVLSRKLGAKDTFSRTRDDGFLICFAELREEAASFAAAMIGREIRARLIGQGEEPASSQIVAIAASVGMPQALPDASAATLAPTPRDLAPADATSLRDMLEQRLDSRRSSIEARARETLADAMTTASCILSPVVGRDGRHVVAQYARLPQALQRRATVAAASLPEAERWRQDLNVLTLRLAGTQALDQILRDRAGNMFLDVSFDVFHSRLGTECYLEACRKLDMSVRQGLVLVLTQVPQGLTSSRMLDCVHRLRPFCRTVGFELDDIGPPDLDLALASGPILVLDAQRLPLARAPSARMARLTSHAHGLRTRVLVRGVEERQTADRLLASGVDLIALESPEMS